MATSLLIGDFDVHWGNIGVISDKKLVRLDFGAAFDHLKGEINPHSISEHLPGLGPTNHFRDFPRTMKLNENFIAELEKVSKENLDQVIDESFKELEKFYSPETIKDFGTRLGVQFQKDDQYVANTVKNRFKEKMKERQVSLKNFATELKMDLCITKDETTREWKLDQSKFEGIVKDNPKYFQEVAEGKRKIKLYDLNHKDKWNPFSPNPNARSLTRVFEAMASVINKVLPKSLQINTNETQIRNLIMRNIEIGEHGKKAQR